MIRNTIRLLFVILSLACWIKPVKLSGCPCKTTSSSEDVIDNHVLKGHVISSLKVNDVGQCFHDCVHDNKCKSFNIGKENNALLCELNESDKNLSPRSLQQNEGWTYYEVNERLPSEPSYFKDCGCTHYNHLICDCIDGYIGTQCKQKARSCLDYLRFKNTYRSGIYNVFDDRDVLFPVYCDMDQTTMSAWTAVLSYAMKFNPFFKRIPFYMDKPINQSSPNWQLYRLSLARMKSIRGSSRSWRASCSYSTFGIDGRDYVVASWKDIDLLTLNSGGCHRFSYINVRGSNCTDCTTWIHQGLQGSRMFLVAVPYGVAQGCSLHPAPPNSNLYDESFGFYTQTHPDFRCSKNKESTTQFWFGGTIV